ncbi:jouberin isoform X1 [Carassius carassius]|uniref:jouberin isoform X1 n=1 Tax=Carassius carassius TaxID=217509 RepID=UPI00286902AE|nr:jouberin isoform X1 [Carassius carassius]
MSVRIRKYLKKGEDLAVAVILLAVCVLFDFVMQQIYTQSHEEFEVFTTVLSPQVCQKRVIFKHQGEMMVVAADYSADCDEELSVRAGEVVLLLYQENADWCYVRLQNGKEGYLPTACFTTKQESLRPSVTQASQSFTQTSAKDRIGCSGGRSLKLLRRASLSGVPGSPRLLQRLLSRRRSDGHAVRSIGSINPAFHPD